MSAALAIITVFLLLLVLSVPIAAAMAVGALTPLLLGERGSSVVQLINNSISGANSTPILAVPLFILGGVIMAEGGISKRLFNFFAYFTGAIPGGLPCAMILTCLFYGAISGSGPATAAAVGAMAIPFLAELGYDKAWSAGLISVAGGLGVIIPPSIPFVLYSLSTGVSTGELFLAGIVPGVLIALSLMIYTMLHCMREREQRQLIEIKLRELRIQGFPCLLRDSLWALLSPVIVLGGIYSGIVSPTEAACISVIYSLAVSLFIYRSIAFKDLPRFLLKAVASYAPLAFVLAFATAFGRVLTLTGATELIESFIGSGISTKLAFITAVTLLFLLLGMIMDTGPAIIILAPILLPIAVSYGVSPVHFGVILVCCLAIGLATPPFGLNIFVAATVAKLKPTELASKALPFILTFLLALALTVYIPQLSLLLL